MRKFILIGIAGAVFGSAQAQNAASTPAGSQDIEALRQQVQALTETVKTLQQQVKDQQITIDRLNERNSSTQESAEPTPIAAAAASPSPSPATTAAPLRFPTEDASVVSSTSTTPAAPSAPGVNATGNEGGNFPTTDSSVVSSAPAETISTTGAGASLTQPIGIGSGKNYMNISFDGLFALAYSSDKHLDQIEVGDHDPMQRGFNARNIELAF